MRRFCCTLVLLATSSSVAAIAQERPRFQNLRFDERWPETIEGDTDPFDALKHIPLDESGAVWIGFGGQARSRIEIYDGWSFGGPGQRSDTFWYNRLRYYADLHVGDHVRVFVEGKNSFASDRDLPGGRRAVDRDDLALQNAFLELNGTVGEAALRFRGGRQEFLFGNQRFVSPRDWSNIRRTWDGASLRVSVGNTSVTGFWSALVIEDPTRFNESSEDTQLFGLSLDHRIGDTLLEAYAWGLHRTPAMFNGTTGGEDRATIGVRVRTPLLHPAVTAEVEAAYQTGEVGSQKIVAGMLGTLLRYAPKATRWSPTFQLGFDYASGDERRGGKVQTFNALFPSGRLYFGYTNILGRPNLTGVNGAVTVRPTDQLALGLRADRMWRTSDDDGIYNLGNAQLRAGNLGNSHDVGLELGTTLTYSFNRHLTGLVGFSYLFAGDFIRESGPDDDMQFTYVQLQFTF